jgi:hypothetical protein
MSGNIEKTDVATRAAQGARNGSHLLGRAIHERGYVDDRNGAHGHRSLNGPGQPRSNICARTPGEGLPLTHDFRILRAIMLKGATLHNLQYDMIALLA